MLQKPICLLIISRI